MVRNLERGRLWAALACSVLLVAACGDDDDTADDTADPAEAVQFTTTRDGVDGPSEIEGGTVEVTFTDETNGTEMELDFVRVEEGTTEDAFREAFAVIFEGGPIDEALLDLAGITLPAGLSTVTETITLPPGEYFVFSELDDPVGEEEGAGDGGEAEGEGGGEDEGGGDEDPLANFVLTALTVTEGGEAEVPGSEGGTIVASDYTFDASDLEAGTHFTFRNDGPDQFHHAVLMDFGALDVATVEEHFPAFLESDGEDMPAEFEGLDEEELFGLGASGVFSPGQSGTFRSDLVEGNTYVAVCFIQDRAGGPPHAIAHDMWEVFTVGG